MIEAPLTILKGGINRLRTKGGARADSLYDLLNGYITDSGTVKSRPGTLRMATLDSSTKGLVSFDGSLHVFSNVVVTVPSGYTLHVVAHPDDSALAITKIHFAKPFLGFLYVVAEFTGGDTFHYWLRLTTVNDGVWKADNIYFHGDMVEPSVATGLAFEATRLGAANPSWAANVPRAIGDIVEPTVYNDFFYTVVDTLGTNPRSGTIEPDWATSDGAQTLEDVDGIGSSTATTTETSSTTTPQTTQDRYG